MALVNERISRPKQGLHLLSSIRWQFTLVNLVLVAVVFGVSSAFVANLVNTYLLTQRVQLQLRNTTSLALQTGAYLAQSDAAELYNLGVQTYDSAGGRIIIVNGAGIVQSDSFSEYNGYLLTFPEIEDVLYGGRSTSYGYHRISEQDGSSFYALYSTSAIVYDGTLIGALLYSTSIQDLVDASRTLQRSMLTIYVIGLACAAVASAVLTQFIARPVKQLTDVALRISAGDLESRASVHGRNEISELGRTFNMMCDRIQNLDVQRSEFVSDASHELKTPLASMKILVESLLYQDNVPGEVYKDFLGDINREIDRLTALITDLLLLSKMDTDEAALNLEKTDLSALVSECVDALKPIAHAREVKVTERVPPGLEIQADPLKLRQALSNLIENAIKYSRDDGHVEIRGGRESGEIFVTVRDDGVGMAEEYLPHVFDRFYRVDKARSRETGGTGLGLYIVRRVALMHGGRVEVESEEGVGSSFTLYLPAVRKT